MKTTHSVKYVVCLMLFFLCIVVTTNANAATVIYTLDNVILDDGEQITGMFYWTSDIEDFEGGSGEFTALEIPYTPHYLGDPDLSIEIQTTSIEITGIGNYHDAGLDISLKFDAAFTPTQSSVIDPNTSSFECCGNGFKDQPFQSGSVSPIPQPANLYHFAILASGWGTTYFLSDLIDLSNAWLASEWPLQSP